MKMQTDYIKANRKVSRDFELENENGWKAVRKIHKSKNNYSRKGKSKFIFNDDYDETY